MGISDVETDNIGAWAILRREMWLGIRAEHGRAEGEGRQDSAERGQSKPRHGRTDREQNTAEQRARGGKTLQNTGRASGSQTEGRTRQSRGQGEGRPCGTLAEQATSWQARPRAEHGRGEGEGGKTQAVAGRTGI
jgi:hypothetical protein